MATTPNRPIRNNDNAELRPPCVRQSRREQKRAAQAMNAVQAYGRQDSEEEQHRVARIARRYNNSLGEIEIENDEDEVVTH